MDNVKFFFVIGTGCSATTWLYQTLQNIPETQIEMYWCFWEDLKEIDRAYNSEQEASKYIEDYRKPRMLHRLKRGIRTYGEINGMLRWHCAALKQAFPSATIVQLVRDGRAWVRSMMARECRFHPNFAMEDVTTRYMRPKDGDKCYERWDSMSRFEKICWEWARTNEYIRQCLGKEIVQMERMLADFSYFRTYLITPFGLEISEKLWTERIKVEGKPDRRVVMPHYSEWDDKILREFNEICSDEMLACGYGGDYDSFS